MSTVTNYFDHGVSRHQYVLGRDSQSTTGILQIGRYLAIDRSSGARVALDALRPHAVLICGKRGYGKSYTMGILIEEIEQLPESIRQNIASVVIDTMGIFWTLGKKNTSQDQILSDWGLEPDKFDVTVFVPQEKVGEYRQRNIDVASFSIRISHMDGYQWCKLFGIGETSPAGTLLIRVVHDLQKSQHDFSIEEIIEKVHQDNRCSSNARDAAENYMISAISWGIFTRKGTDISELVKSAGISVIDVSTVKNNSARAAIVRIIGLEIYQRRLDARRMHEKRMMNEITEDISGIPMVWMFIDEAHLFIPADSRTLASDVLINEWLRQGRQPGLSIVFATQRPSAIDPDVISQSDIVICHRLTAGDDIKALESTRPTHMKESFSDSIKKLGQSRGVGLIVDDTSETTHVIRMRPRLSWHGGDEPLALPLDKARTGDW